MILLSDRKFQHHNLFCAHPQHTSSMKSHKFKFIRLSEVEKEFISAFLYWVLGNQGTWPTPSLYMRCWKHLINAAEN